MVSRLLAKKSTLNLETWHSIMSQSSCTAYAHAVQACTCMRTDAGVFEFKLEMATIEPFRVRAYGEDLRWRMVYQCEALGYSYQKIATNLCVDASTVWRTVQLFQQTGSVEKKKYSRGNLPRKVNGTIQLVVLHTVLEQPGLYLREIQSQVEYLTGLIVSLSTIC